VNAVDHGYATVVLRRGRVSGLIGVRSIVVCAVVIVVILALSIVALGIGTYQLSPAQVVGALLGTDDDAKARLLVATWRLPRVLFAIACGISLAVSGTIFQSLTRNPLGSPDIIGFSTGSYTGVVVMTLGIGSTGYLDRAAAAIVGGGVTAAVVYLLSVSRGSVRPFRLIIMGIGVGALLGSLNSALMISSDLDAAMLTAVWAAGSLYGLGHAQLWPMVALLVVMLPLVAFIAPGMRQLELGDEAARGLGVRANRVQASAVVLGVALTALVTAAAGPISFIALAAPQIARRLTRGSGLGLVPAALVGAVLLLASDVLAQQLGFPVGIVTVSVGGAYLVWLLAAEYRKRK
jgi:iron complex transport system permease protein